MEVDGIEVLTDAAEVCRRMEADTVIGFDTETSGLSPWRNNIAVVQVYGDQTSTLGVVQIKDGVIPEYLCQLLCDQKRLVIGHNVVNFDLLFLQTHGVPWYHGRWYDTLVGETVLNTTSRHDIRKSLGESVRRRLNLEIDKRIQHGNWGAMELSPEQVAYAARDVISLPALMRAQQEKAKQTRQLEALEMEMELMPYVSMMSSTGLPLRRELLLNHWAKMNDEAREAEEKAWKVFGPINLNSHVQIKKAIHAVTGYRIASTQADAMMDLLANDQMKFLWPVLELILEYRTPAQFVKMYDEDWANEFIVDDWVHGRFWQCSADTNRFTSSDPNLQQWPKKARFLIGNMEGLKVVAGDYSQIEVRIAAEIANDEKLLATLTHDDVHTAIASEVYKLPQSQISKEQRKNAKALTFALLFDGTANTLYRHSRSTGGKLTYSECIGLERLFFESFTGLRQMRQRARELVSKNGKMTTVRLPNSLTRHLIGPKRTASRVLNTMVQGTAGIGIKYGIIEAGKRGLVKGYMGAQVHDELVSTVPVAEAEEYSKELQEAMVIGMNKVIKSLVKVEMKVNDYWEV